MSTTKIRKVLLQELDNLMAGETYAKHSKAVAKIAGQAIYTTRLEIENKRIEAKLMKDTKKDRWKFIDGKDVSVPSIKF